MKKELISKLISELETEWKTEGEPQRFSVQIETGEVVEAEMLTVLEIGEDEYAIYAIPGKPGKKDIMASRVVQKMAGEANPGNIILMQAVGANVSGQVASAIIGGILLGLF